MHKKLSILLLVLFIMTLAMSNSWAQISSSERERVSNEILMKMARKYGPPRSVSASEPLGRIFNQVVQNAKRRDINYRISIIDNKEVNAITLPNGQVVFFTGLLRALPSNDDSPVAFVVAHEVSHMEKSHIEKKINQAAVTGTLIGILTNRSNSLVQLLGVVANELVTSGYSRDMEYEADREALLLMRKSGYDPSGSLVVFKTLERLESKNSGTRIFPTHPKAADRYRSVQVWMKSQGIAYNENAGTAARPNNTVNTMPTPTSTPAVTPSNGTTGTGNDNLQTGKIKVPVVDYSDLTIEDIRNGEYLTNWEDELDRGLKQRLGSNIESTGNSRQLARLQTFEKSQSSVQKNRIQLVFMVEPEASFAAFWNYLEKNVIPGLRNSNRVFKTIGVGVKENVPGKKHIVIIMDN